jgi:hypothetical protein
MNVTQGGQTLFARALKTAADLFNDLPAQTVVHVAYFDDRDVYPASDNKIDRTRQPGYAGTDFGLALRWARDQLVQSQRRDRQVYLLTDLQRSGLYRSACDGFPVDVPVELLEVGNPLVANLSVESADLVQPWTNPQEPVIIAARVSNASPFPARNLPVRLALEGDSPRLEQTQTVSLAPGEQQTVRFSQLIRKPGLYTGFVEVAGNDEFKLDDRRWLALEARPPDRLLLADGEPGATVYTNETYYLETALRLRLPGKGAARMPYEPERLAWAADAQLPDLSAYRVVVLCNVPGLAAGDVARLQAYVSGGGRLLIFTGGRVRPEGYAPLVQAGLLPGQVEGNSELEAFRFDSWDKEHPIFRPLSDPQQGDLRRIVFRRITRLKALPGAKVLASSQAGDPLLLESRLERGTVLLLASSVDRDWSDWPQTRLYLPMLHQLIGYLAQRLPENQLIHTATTGPDRPPGITRNGAGVVVAKLDPRESEMERVTAQQFREVFRLAEPDVFTRKADAKRSVLLPPNSQRPDEVWMYIAWALLLVLGVEVLVANRTVG